MNTPDLCQHAFSYDELMMQGDRCCHLSVHQRAAMQQLNAKIFKLSFEYLHIYSSKSGDFAEKIAKLHH